MNFTNPDKWETISTSSTDTLEADQLIKLFNTKLSTTNRSSGVQLVEAKMIDDSQIRVSTISPLTHKDGRIIDALCIDLVPLHVFEKMAAQQGWPALPPAPHS